MKTLFIFFISCFVISGLFLANNILAQETETGDVEEAEEIEEITVDEDITAGDLGISEPKVLPDSPFYFIKNLWRGVRSAFTFNKVKKAELRLSYANERLIEAKKLAEKIGKEEIVQKTIEKYQNEIEKVKTRVENFKEKAQDNPKIDQFLDRLTDRTIKQQQLMDRLEKNLSDKPEVLEHIQAAKEKSLENFGTVIEQLEENKERIQERLEKNLEQIEGSQYKNFKNLEVLIRLEDKVPEQAKEAIQQAQENSLKRLNDKLEQMSPQDQEKFGTYLDNISGDQTTHLEILERLNERELLPTLKEKVEQNRERAQERVESIKEDAEQLRERIQERIQEQTPEQIQEQTREQTREQACVTVWDPVCGKDGKTYSNACFAKLAGVEIAYKGKCKIRCETSITCERGYDAVDTGKIDDSGCPIKRCVKTEEKECRTDADCPQPKCSSTNTTSDARCIDMKARCINGKCVTVEVQSVK